MLNVWKEHNFAFSTALSLNMKKEALLVEEWKLSQTMARLGGGTPGPASACWANSVYSHPFLSADLLGKSHPPTSDCQLGWRSWQSVNESFVLVKSKTKRRSYMFRTSSVSVSWKKKESPWECWLSMRSFPVWQWWATKIFWVFVIEDLNFGRRLFRKQILGDKKWVSVVGRQSQGECQVIKGEWWVALVSM